MCWEIFHKIKFCFLSHTLFFFKKFHFSHVNYTIHSIQTPLTAVNQMFKISRLCYCTYNNNQFNETKMIWVCHNEKWKRPKAVLFYRKMVWNVLNRSWMTGMLRSNECAKHECGIAANARRANASINVKKREERVRKGKMCSIQIATQ